MHAYIKKIEDLEPFKYPFERLRQVETQFDEPAEEKKQEDKIEEKKPEEEEDEEP